MTTIDQQAEVCRCGHLLGNHYFGGECQHGHGPMDACNCRQFGKPLNRSDAEFWSNTYFVHLGDIHAGLSLWHCLRCSSVVEKTARDGHDRWHDSVS